MYLFLLFALYSLFLDDVRAQESSAIGSVLSSSVSATAAESVTYYTTLIVTSTTYLNTAGDSSVYTSTSTVTDPAVYNSLLATGTLSEQASSSASVFSVRSSMSSALNSAIGSSVDSLSASSAASSAASLSASSAASHSSTSVNPSQTGSSGSVSLNKGLSTGDKAGISIGVVIGVVAVVAVAFFVLQRRKLRTRSNKVPEIEEIRPMVGKEQKPAIAATTEVIDRYGSRQQVPVRQQQQRWQGEKTSQPSEPVQLPKMHVHNSNGNNNVNITDDTMQDRVVMDNSLYGFQPTTNTAQQSNVRPNQEEWDAMYGFGPAQPRL